MTLAGTPTARQALSTFADTDSPDMNGNLDIILNQIDALLPTVIRRTTAVTVNTTVTATDLLGGSGALAAGIMGTTRVCTLTAWGNYLNNSGGAVAGPRLQLILGATTLLDTGALTTFPNTATRGSWELEATILNSTATAQSCRMKVVWGDQSVGGYTLGATAFTTGSGANTTIADGTGGALISLSQGTNSTTVDTSGALVLALKVINGSANAAYETKLLGATLVIL